MMRLLYVEDDPHHADLTVRRLRKTAPHVQVETVSAIREALARLDRIASEPLDMVLTDVRLRDGDGLSLLQHIREHSLPLAVVLITGMGDEETAVAALKARADDYVVKRKDYLDRLPIILESALNHYRADAARRAHPLTILYAENELSDVETTRRHLAVHADHLCLEAIFSGPELLSALRSPAGGPRADVLLLSFDLRELNALEVLRELRLAHQQDMPVVLLCREGDEDIARQGLKLGASGYLVKRPGYLYQLPWELEEAHSRADLQRREAALQTSEARNRAILNAIPDMMFLQSPDGTYLDYHAPDNRRLLAPPEQFLGKKVTDVMPPRLAADFMRCFEQALETDKPVLYEYELEVPDGVRTYEASIISCASDKILSIVRDITERKEAEEALRGSEARLRLAQQAARVGTWEWDLKTGELVWSEMIWELLGLEPTDNLTTTVERFIELIHPADRDRAMRKVNEVIAAGEEYDDEFRLIRRDGEILWLSSKGRVIRSASGEPERMLGVKLDITGRKQAEQAIGFQAHLLNTIEQAVVATDLGGTVIFWNQFAERLYGWSSEEAMGREAKDLLRHDQPDRAEEIWSLLRKGQSWAGEFMIRRRDGTTLPVWVNNSPIYDERGGLVGVIGISHDITERKRAEDALKGALAEVGRLKDRLQEENIYLREEVRVASNFGELIGDSQALKTVLGQAEQVAKTDTTVLVLGETGTGKELLAHAIHGLSPRRRRPLVKVNCAALPAPLIEAELFGHEKGAFTGATAQRRGRFEIADGGTIFLDEVGDMPLDLQAKLLRVLELGEFERVGGSRTQHVDVRVIAATNRNLKEAVQKGAFRSDLYYRLSVYPVTSPPLRERREDIPMLATHFVRQLSSKMGKEIRNIPQNVMTTLRNYDWPGNVRELRNVIERAVIITRGPTLQLTEGAESPTPEAGPHPPGMPFDSPPAEHLAAGTLEQNEYNLILRTLRRVNWKIEGPGGAAQLLDIHPSTLRTRMKKLGITRGSVARAS